MGDNCRLRALGRQKGKVSKGGRATASLVTGAGEGGEGEASEEDAVAGRGVGHPAGFSFLCEVEGGVIFGGKGGMVSELRRERI